MSDIVFPPDNPGTSYGGLVGTVPDAYLPGSFIIQQSNTNTNLVPCVQVAAGAADAVLFANPINICIFTSTTDTGAGAATLSTPASSDAGKILILINTNTTQNLVKTASGKILNGGTPGATLTAPAAGGAVTVLVATNGFWNIFILGTGTWVLS